jgi:hypothetical protein
MTGLEEHACKMIKTTPPTLLWGARNGSHAQIFLAG